MNLPSTFTRRMRALMGAESEALFAALEQPPLVGLRVNTLKIRPEEFRALVPWELEPVPWCPAGFIVTSDAQPGKHPYHAAGLYYLQEPSAMAVAAALAPQLGERVLDLAAAPGGKATHLAALINDTGLLVANEIESSRTRGLASNLERWGSRHAVIMNEAPQRLAERWGAIFDRVLVDAPCSGEGMFRKTPAALTEWSEEHVHGCSARQRRLIDTAAALVRPGGFMGYSTCTFAPEENEQVIADFLAEHEDFALRPIALPGVSHGRPSWAGQQSERADMTLTARLWPHMQRGEGHFVALLQRTSGDEAHAPPLAVNEAPRQARAMWRAFVAATMTNDPAADAQLTLFGAHLYAVPEDTPPVDGMRVVRGGLWLGTIQRDRLEPSHSLALALRAADARQSLDLQPEDERLARYLQGHPLPEAGEPGWVLITVSGFPIGWGRRAQGIIKNAYPKGLRRPLA
ncbi:MAG TPA: RsmF rRNA methyltransferase first C-terminal domain-containing protein [Roseiflexaceae bacterium]|nr:RsmF rRNA methyltransferase first C-terminal domain-containing protein [Roseiflexaceae bacterium]